MTLVLRADSIAKSYGERRVLASATLRALAGKIGYLVGRNGCGKSTLLRIAAGDLSSDGGVVVFKGRAALRPHWPTLATQGLFFLPDRELLSPGRTVQSHLDSITRQFGTPNSAEAIDALELSSLLGSRCGELSTGECRRVEVAMALTRRPDCLLADEPYRNIDPRDRQLIAAALRALAVTGCAVVITGHEVEELFESADLVTWCTDGTTYELGTPTEAIADWRFSGTYLGGARAAGLQISLKPSCAQPRTT
jgi:ABC-type multidrug transport system ATPase subunit